MEQKFKRGNLVKVLVGHEVWSNKGGISDVRPEDVEREAIIEYSYNDKYGGGNINDYSIIWRDTGSSMAWKGANELELIDEGGDHLLAEAKATRERLLKANTDLAQIKSAWNEKQGKQNSDTILFLFNKIGFESSFLSNGEFYALFADWSEALPLFDLIFNAKTEEEILSKLNPKFLDKYKDKIVSLFKEIQSLNQ